MKTCKKTLPFILMVKQNNATIKFKLKYACVELWIDDEDEDARGSDPLIRELDLNTVVPAEL